MGTRFDYDDSVRVRTGVPGAPTGAKAWIVGVTASSDRHGSHYDSFKPGNVYTIEFEDGASIDVHESDLEPVGESSCRVRSK
ncbi:MAG TPA: hypothetical protein VFG73_01495 [Rhodanobacteraceae bacterium]|nr:hypothetical protein [Rhodanobacteraceae bacterium]